MQFTVRMYTNQMSNSTQLRYNNNQIRMEFTLSDSLKQIMSRLECLLSPNLNWFHSNQKWSQQWRINQNHKISIRDISVGFGNCTNAEIKGSAPHGNAQIQTTNVASVGRCLMFHCIDGWICCREMSSTLSESLLLLLLILCFRYSFRCYVMVHTHRLQSPRKIISRICDPHTDSHVQRTVHSHCRTIRFFLFCCCAPERNNSVLTNIYFVFDFFPVFSLLVQQCATIVQTDNMFIYFGPSKEEDRDRDYRTRNRTNFIDFFPSTAASLWCGALCFVLRWNSYRREYRRRTRRTNRPRPKRYKRNNAPKHCTR